jgi:hypothetical protein
MNTLKNITIIQWFGIIILFNTTLLGGASQLGDLSLTAAAVKAILAVATLGNGFLGGLVTMFGGQGTQINNVVSDPQAQAAIVHAMLDMPGLEKMQINGLANKTLASFAVDPTQPKIEAIPTAEAKVVSIAKAS